VNVLVFYAFAPIFHFTTCQFLMMGVGAITGCFCLLGTVIFFYKVIPEDFRIRLYKIMCFDSLLKFNSDEKQL